LDFIAHYYFIAWELSAIIIIFNCVQLNHRPNFDANKQIIMTDYGKWDKFAAEQTDSDEERQAPKVQTVGDGQAVRIGPKGYEIGKEDTHCTNNEAETHHARVEEIVTETDRQKWVTNGARGDNYYWRQDRQEVVLVVMLDSQVKGKDIHITYDASSKALQIQDGSSGAVILSGTMKHGIDTESMTQANPQRKSVLQFDPADWEVKTLSTQSGGTQTALSSSQHTRFIELTMRKVSPLPGAVFWWNACFTNETEIDVTKIAGRSNRSSGSAGGATGADTDAERRAYEARLAQDPYVQAQKMFAERMRNSEKVELDLGDS
jgi:hypothetical protein